MALATGSIDPTGGVRELRYMQVEGAFSNPNGDVAEVTAAWLYDTVAQIRELRGREASNNSSGSPPPLLPSLVELYCGMALHHDVYPYTLSASSFASSV
jgi:hypothetical protein